MVLISINQAAAMGIDRLRQPRWANLEDYLKIDIIDGKAGPWGHLYSPANEAVNGRNPVDMLLLQGRDDAVFIDAASAQTSPPGTAPHQP